MHTNNATCKFYMLAAENSGTIAEMPLEADDYSEADAIARQWLYTFDHGFSKAIVVTSIYRNQMTELCETTQEIWHMIMHTMLTSAIVFDETMPETDENPEFDQGLVDYIIRKRDE